MKKLYLFLVIIPICLYGEPTRKVTSDEGSCQWIGNNITPEKQQGYAECVENGGEGPACCTQNDGTWND